MQVLSREWKSEGDMDEQSGEPTEEENVTGVGTVRAWEVEWSDE